MRDVHIRGPESGLPWGAWRTQLQITSADSQGHPASGTAGNPSPEEAK